MDNRPLKIKALEAAIKQMKAAKTRDEANGVYRTWTVFHSNADFKKAVLDKQKEFNNQKSIK